MFLSENLQLNRKSKLFKKNISNYNAYIIHTNYNMTISNEIT